MAAVRRFFALAVLVAWLSGCAPAPPPAPQGAALPAGGVVSHLGYFDTPYADAGAVAAAVKAMEAKLVRDSIGPDQAPEYYSRIYAAFRRVAARSGAKFLLVATRADRSVTAQLDAMAPLVADGIVWGIEGANEWDNVAGQSDQRWKDQLRAHQIELYRAVKARWPDMPVVGPSLSYKVGSAVGDLSANLDYGNLHYYGLTTGVDTRDLDERIANARMVSGGKPLWATESNGVVGDGYVGTEPDQATVMRQLYELLGERGVDRVFSYELVNAGRFRKYPATHRENNFGSYEITGKGRWRQKPVFFEVRTANRRG